MFDALTFCGQLPNGFTAAFAELQQDLNFTCSETGFSVTVCHGSCLRLEKSTQEARISWAKPVQLYRALSLLRQHWDQPLCIIEEHPCFETVGMMFDVSRNAVLKPSALRFFVRKMALMGLELGMMYTEDTYEVPNQPYFGYQRGRYSAQELRELDDYAFAFGIELCPCIQTLGHLNRALHWPALSHLKDNEEVVLVDEPKTYEFLEQLITAASAPYRSRRIHLGMDEAHGIGLGVHLRRHGFEDPHAIIRRHLNRVLEIVQHKGLEPMMWSDMYFRPDSPTGGYYDGPSPTAEARESVCPNVTLVYWDYYHETQTEYDAMLQKHAALAAPTAFAGGIWTWCGPAPDYTKTYRTVIPALNACKNAGVPLVLAAAWGDNGAEANLLTALLGMQLYAEFSYTGGHDAAALAQRFACCCKANMNAFANLSMFNAVPGMRSGSLRPVNAAKFLLYQDPLVQLYAQDTAGLPMAEHYATLHSLYSSYAAENPEYQLLFDFYAQLALVLQQKCSWHQQASQAVRSHDLALAHTLAQQLSDTVQEVEILRIKWFELWRLTNKPHGFEIIDLRLGGIKARLATAALRISEFAAGNCTDIPELSQPPLPYTLQSDGTLFGSYAVGEIVSACKIDL